MQEFKIGDRVMVVKEYRHQYPSPHDKRNSHIVGEYGTLRGLSTTGSNWAVQFDNNVGGYGILIKKGKYFANIKKGYGWWCPPCIMVHADDGPEYALFTGMISESLYKNIVFHQERLKANGR
jgi:hypothetical protein